MKGLLDDICRFLNTAFFVSSGQISVFDYFLYYRGSIMSTNDQNVFNVTDRSTLSDAPPYVLKLLAVDE